MRLNIWSKLTGVFLAVVLVLFACQKESSFEKIPLSKGNLRDSVGNCVIDTATGVYVKDSSVNTGNTVSVGVSVVKTGSYTIKSDTVNGLYFSASGTFSALGNNRVILRAGGRPTVVGTQIMKVFYDSSFCEFEVTVRQGTAGGGGTSQGNLGGSPGACTNATLAGTYIQGTALNANNRVTIDVTVTTVGTYNITTNSVGGMTFSASGTFTATGPQTIVLNGGGTPTTAGNNVLTVSYGSSSCNFTVNCQPGVAPLDYFPTTTNTNWSFYTYNVGGAVIDTELVVVQSANETIAGNSYRVLRNHTNDKQWIRKVPNQYFLLLDSLTAFDNPVVNQDILFLKDNANVNDTWESQEISGTSGGVATKIKIVFKILATQSSLTVGTLPTFPDVIQVQETYQAFIGGVWVPAGAVFKRSYARGVGLIKVDDLSPTPSPEEVRVVRYQVF
jgi:hypothetical protein